MGRPTDNPKVKTVRARLDEDSAAILYEYCNQEQVTESEGVRRGIFKLMDDLKQEKEEE